MKIRVTRTVDVEVRFLQASCAVRYWEDAEVDGVADEDGSLIPCRNGENWEPLIDLETGVILNWMKGKAADIHYKVCDAGEYALLDADKRMVTKIEGYVPEIMAPAENGYGDYVIMSVDADGRIDDWRAVLTEFSASS